MAKKLGLLLILLICIQLPACRSRVSHYSDVKSSHAVTTTFGLVFISKEFSQQDRKQITAAIETWNYVLNGYHRFEIQESRMPVTDEQCYTAFISGGFTVQKIYAGNDEYMSEDEMTGEKIKILAWVNKIGGHRIWLVKNRMSQKDIYYIVLHEIGHILGAQHVKSRSLMAPQYEMTQYSCVDKSTVMQVAEHMAIPEPDLNYCHMLPPEKR